LTIEQFAQQSRRLCRTIRLQEQVCRSLPDGIVPGILVENGEIFFQGGIHLAFLQELFRLFNAFGNIRHSESSAAQN
jgi:hypothetical protein